MRLAIVTPEYGRGGIGAEYAALAPALAVLGVEVHIFRVPGPDGRTEMLDGVVVHGVSVARRMGPLWGVARCIAARRAVAASGTFDAIIAADWMGDAALLSAAQCGRSITHLHTCRAVYNEISGLAGGVSTHSPRARLGLRLEKRQGERSAGILACSQALLDRTRRHWAIGSLPAAVTPNVVAVQEIRRLGTADVKSVADLTLVDGDPTIVMPGRLETRKGVGVLLRAMPAVWREYPDARLLLVGTPGTVDGLPVAERVNTIARDYADRVQIVGRLSHDVLFPLLRGADVVVTPSLWEAFGIASLEAMALGCRVVATSGSGFSEFCEDGVNCVLVHPSDTHDLAAGILRALGDEQNSLGRAAETTARRFDASHRAGGFVKSVEDVLPSAGTSDRRRK